MNLRKLAILGIGLLFMGLAGKSVKAQTESRAPRTFSLQDAVEYALRNYPAVRASLEQVSAARAGVSLAHSQYLPQLAGVYQASRATQNQVPGIWLPSPLNAAVEGSIGASSGQSFWATQAGALFSWEPFDFGLRASQVDRAHSAEQRSNADAAVTRLQVATAVGNYFLNVLAAEQAVTAAQANIDRWQVFNKSVHTLVSNELRPGADASRADAQLALATTGFYQAQATEQAALATLATLMGAAGADIKLDAGRLLAAPPAEALPSSAPADNPLAEDQRAAVRQSQAQEKVLARTDYPRFFLQAEGFARGSEVPSGGTIIGNWNGLAPARGDWVAGITVTFPNVFDFKALGAEKQIARAHERSEQALYDKTIQDLTGQIKAALSQLKSAQLIAQQTPLGVKAARESETQSRARYDADLATLVEVADSEGLLVQAETDDAIARVNLWRCLFALAYAQGNLQPFLQLLGTNAP